MDLLGGLWLLLILLFAVLKVEAQRDIGSRLLKEQKQQGAAKSGRLDVERNLLLGAEGVGKQDLRPKQCVPITIPLCKNIGYNLTYTPNEFQHETQEEAGLVVHQFHPLIEISCSDDLRLFLCSMYAPICIPTWSYKIRACRSLCESARDSCLPVMVRYGFKWPQNIDCDKLTEEPACLKRDKVAARSSPLPVGCRCSCRAPFVRDDRAQFNTVFTGGTANCLQSCHHASFAGTLLDNRTFVTFWLGLWSVLCCLSSTGTLLTFLLDRARFQYPERPIVFLCACYAMVSLGFLVRVVLGHEAIACEDEDPATAAAAAVLGPGLNSGGGMADLTTGATAAVSLSPFRTASGRRLRYGTTGPAKCSVVFLLIYFFGMAASVWWVILSVTWFLSAGLKWGSEAIAKYSEIFHFVAWFLPGVKSLLALTLVAVDGDPVAGICYVGNTSRLHLQVFVIGPLTLYLLLGAGFLLAGFISLVGIRRTIRAKGHSKTDRLEKLMLRIGIFGLLYSVPAAVVIGCHVYELRGRDAWQAEINCVCPSSDKSTQGRMAPPEYSIFMLKYFMCLVVGITSGFWVWTSKTLDSWYNAFRRLSRRRSRTQPPTNSLINNTNNNGVRFSKDQTTATLRMYPQQQQAMETPMSLMKQQHPSSSLLADPHTVPIPPPLLSSPPSYNTEPSQGPPSLLASSPALAMHFSELTATAVSRV